MSDNKRICTECGWIGSVNDVLVASNPFAKRYEIVGCPECKDVESIVVACDVDGCKKQATCGTPTSAGYRHTCGEHAP